MDRKFYKFTQDSIQYQHMSSGFFKSYPAKFYNIMIYEEDGKFYELLTGQILGICKNYKNSDNKYIFSEEFGYSIPLSGYSINRYAHMISPEEFAKQARIYMEEKDKIIPYINKKFNQWRNTYKEELKKEALKNHAEEQKKIDDKQNIDWLTNLLNKRK